MCAGSFRIRNVKGSLPMYIMGIRIALKEVSFMSFPSHGREGGWQLDDMGLSGGMLDFLP
jgi:hypothetical protein